MKNSTKTTILLIVGALIAVLSTIDISVFSKKIVEPPKATAPEVIVLNPIPEVVKPVEPIVSENDSWIPWTKPAPKPKPKVVKPKPKPKKPIVRHNPEPEFYEEDFLHYKLRMFFGLFNF